MSLPDHTNSLANLAGLLFFLASLVWLAVGSAAFKHSKHANEDTIFNRLGVAAYLTGAAFLLGFVAWLG